MPIPEPSFSLGIEEEYLLVDAESRALTQAPEGLMEDCAAELEGQVSPEFLQCQIEVGTKVCRNIAQARDELKWLRACIRKHAGTYGMVPIAVSCHPFADWKDQHHTRKDRYSSLQEALGGVANRMLICGNHQHVGIEDRQLRIDLLPQMTYFLPHLLALSCSSPYWQGQDTRLQSYRLTVFDNLPRTGLPPVLDSWDQYERTTGILVDLGIIEDTTKIWWDLRPSHRYPTLENRICDVSPRLEHALSLAALTQSILRMLWRLRASNQRWRQYERFLIAENRWRALRYGPHEGLIDFGAQAIVPMSELVGELIALVEQDAERLECLEEINALREITEGGTSSDRQRAAYADAREAGADHHDALIAVVDHLAEEYAADL